MGIVIFPAMMCDKTQSIANQGSSPEPRCAELYWGSMVDFPHGGPLVSSPPGGSVIPMWPKALITVHTVRLLGGQGPSKQKHSSRDHLPVEEGKSRPLFE